MPARTDPPRGRKNGRRKADQFTRRRNRLRTGTAGGFRPAIVRAHRRSSTSADSSPPRSKAARIAAASASVTTNIGKDAEHASQAKAGQKPDCDGLPAIRRRGRRAPIRSSSPRLRPRLRLQPHPRHRIRVCRAGLHPGHRRRGNATGHLAKWQSSSCANVPDASAVFEFGESERILVSLRCAMTHQKH